MSYETQLLFYARRTLAELYAFAVQHDNQPLKTQLAELLAFAPEDQLKDIAKRLNYQNNPQEFISKSHEAWRISDFNPSKTAPKKSASKSPSKAAPKLTFLRKNFR
jgi:hypothetical protein